MKLIINGDDLGITEGVNRGIITAFEEGLLRSASIIAAGEAFGEAADYAARNPGLDTGVHFCLCDEEALTSVSDIYRGAFKGPLLPSRAVLAAGLYSGLISRRALKREMRAQIERIKSAGIKISHADSHQYVHLLPGIFPISAALCGECGIKFLRSTPADPIDPEAGAGRLLQYAMVAGVSWFSRAVSPPKNVRADLPCLGFTHSGGGLSAERVEKILGRFEGREAVELVVHPGADLGRCREKYGFWGYDWKNDRDLACSPDLAALLTSMKIELTSFKELG